MLACATSSSPVASPLSLAPLRERPPARRDLAPEAVVEGAGTFSFFSFLTVGVAATEVEALLVALRFDSAAAVRVGGAAEV